ncbi:hypothetical protein [Burkholderia glumae]|uniref:hypothetical protein n=2 Tax=Burkholderia glumae TaxID=337 RepID=UPI001373C6C3|nr:hypothetical protein [Burkholderia glumae]MCR1768129.1 hypothetical protein [Burkholderia glumae]QHP92807.1 hypothetical protein EXE55_17630 [Burkholderia glumae]
MRDQQGIPVMMGTSGTASDVTRFHRYALDHLPSSSQQPATQSHGDLRLLADLSFHYLRTGPVVGQVNASIAAHEQRQNLQKIEDRTAPRSPMATQTHSYMEVRDGVMATGRTKPQPKSKL